MSRSIRSIEPFWTGLARSAGYALLGVLVWSCGATPATDPAVPGSSSSTPATATTDKPAEPSSPGTSAATPSTPASSTAAATPTQAPAKPDEPEVSDLDPGDSGSANLGSHHAKPVIEANRPFLNRTCWAAAVKENSSGPAKVKVAIEVEVQPDGKVSKAVLVGGKEYPGFAACVDKHVRRWKFPKAKNTSSLMFPIEFSHSDVQWREKEKKN